MSGDFWRRVALASRVWSTVRPSAAGSALALREAEMHLGRLLALLIAGILLSGCNAIQRIEGKAAFSVGAVPLDFTDPADQNNINTQWANFKASMAQSGVVSVTTKKDYLGFVASASEARCADFLTNLVVASNATHTGLDMATTVFSALATAFTPLATVHALTAGATISSGWRANIDADIYAKIAVQNMVQAIQSTYYTKISGYVGDLANLNEADISVPAELTKIQTIHAFCTLASAEGSVSASLKAPDQSQAGPTATATLTITVSGANGIAATGDSIKLGFNSPSVANTIPPVTIKRGDDATSIAKNVVTAVNNANISGISATSSAGTVSLVAPVNAGWNPAVSKNSKSGVVLSYKAPAPATSGAAPGSAVPKSP
jgi:hypothetical protein